MSIWDVFDKISAEKGGLQKPEFIIAGLGNPGIQYERTRHNAGFMAIAAMEEKYGFAVQNHKYKALVTTAQIGGKSCLIMKPETFMNNSGEAIEQARAFSKIPLENVLVIYDDISLEPGHLRIRRRGSAGGHNGIKSIIALCGGEDFPRIKIGVGKKPGKWDLADWVLAKFPDDAKDDLSSALENAAEAVKLMVNDEIDKAMNLYNS